MKPLKLSSGRAKALTRSERVTMPTTRPPSTTGSRLTRRSSMTCAASATGRFGSITIAGAVIASPAVRASSFSCPSIP